MTTRETQTKESEEGVRREKIIKKGKKRGPMGEMVANLRDREKNNTEKRKEYKKASVKR